MPTNAQRYGTRNLTVNLPVEYISELGRAALQRFNRSRSKLVAEFLEAGAAKHDPALALRLKAIRRQFYALGLLFLFCGTLFSHDVVRRAARRGRSETFLSADFAD